MRSKSYVSFQSPHRATVHGDACSVLSSKHTRTNIKITPFRQTSTTAAATATTPINITLYIFHNSP